jgi:hypothetical protein
MNRQTGGLMRACTQPGCIGTIVDGYCDVCGSPAGAIPFVPAEAAASAGSPSPSDEPGAVGRGSEVSPEPKSQAVDTACAQPGCMGTIVDGYCDVCGSPAGAVPFVPAETAASTRSPAPAEEAGITASPALTPAPAPVDEEIPTRPTPRVKMTRQQLTTQEMADPGAADPGDVDAGKVDAEKVDPAADDVEKVDVEKELLEDIQGSREVEATLRRLITPAAADLERGDTAGVERAAADLEEGDTAEVEPAAADIEKADTAEVEPAPADIERADTAPAGPQHNDTVRMPGVPAVFSGDRHQHPQLPEQQVIGPEQVQTPAKKRRIGYLALTATALAALLIGALLFAAGRDRGVTAQSVPSVTATATATVTKPTSEPSGEVTHTGREERTIQLEDLADSARSFQAVRIQGTYRGGAGTFLRVQRWEGGKWLDFPLPTKTDQSGRFITQAEFGQPGRYQLRVLDPDSGVTSNTFVVVITG